MTIYVPDDLATMVKDHEDLNVSATCQAALRAEVERRQVLAKLAPGMKRVVVRVATRNGSDFDEPRDLAFVGKELYWSGKTPDLWAYLTRRNRIAVYDHDAEQLWEFDTFEDLVNGEGAGGPEAWGFGPSGELVAGVAARLGESHVIELDI